MGWFDRRITKLYCACAGEPLNFKSVISQDFSVCQDHAKVIGVAEDLFVAVLNPAVGPSSFL